jgi:putative chitinase
VYGLGNPRKARELGNRSPGDGYNFRGCGIQQLTGRADHERYAARIGCAVEAMSQPANSILGALIEWGDKHCDADADRDDVVAVRRKINGGVNGLANVRLLLAHAKQIWPESPPSVQQPAAADADAAAMALGSSGPAVQHVQQRLTDAGYPVGLIDGRFGVLTERQVAGFQVQHGLPGTGRVDAATLAAIDQAEPVSAVPGRQDLTRDDLAGRDPHAAVAQSMQTAAKVGGTITTLYAADQTSGLGLFDMLIGYGERISSLFGRSSYLLGGAVSPKAILIGAGLVGSFFLYRLANKSLDALLAKLKRGG